MPLVMTVLSGLYLFYVINSENTTLVADPYGGDPGGKALPLLMGIFLFQVRGLIENKDFIA